MRRWAAVIGVVVVVAVLWAMRGWVVEAIGVLVEVSRGAGAWGVVLFAVAYVVATVVGAPASLLTLGAGLVWGPWAVLLVWPSATVGAVIAFLLARTALRERVRRWLEGWPRLAAVEGAVADGGPTLVLLLRLSPVFPFNVLNYALGTTGVSFRGYVLATAVGILPGTLMFVWVGSTMGSFADVAAGRADAGSAGLVLKIVGLVATVVVTALITVRARRLLNERLETAP